MDQTSYPNDKIEWAEKLCKRCENLVAQRIQGADQLLRRVQTELKFLRQLPASKLHQLRSTNLAHFDAILKGFDSYSNVKAVLEAQGSIKVDIVADYGVTWVKMIARNPLQIHRIWAGDTDNKSEHSIVEQATAWLEEAKSSGNPQVIFHFLAGVTKSVAEELEKLSVIVRGQILPNFYEIEKNFSDDEKSSIEENEENSDEEEKKSKKIEANDENSDDEAEKSSTSSKFSSPRRKFHPEIPRFSQISERPFDVDDSAVPKIPQISERPFDVDVSTTPKIPQFSERPLNLDVSTMFALCSNLTNGFAEFEFQEPLLNEQAEWERKSPVLPSLLKMLEGKRLIICRSAFESFQEILKIVGGPMERQRAEEWLKKIEIVDDRISQKVAGLFANGKIKERAKTIFGTGDFYNAITVTANKGFLLAAQSQHVRLTAIIHESRALSEQKQTNAKRLNK